MAILNGNNIGNEQDRAFTKQPTSQLFEGLTTLNRVSNAVTNLGADINTITTGAGIEGDVLKHLVSHIADPKEKKDARDFKQAKKLIDDINKNKISGKGIMPKFVKGSKEAKDYMASIRAKRGKGRGIDSDSDSEGKGIAEDVVKAFTVKKGRGVKGGNLKDYLNDKVWSKIPEAYHAPIEQIGRQGIKDLGFGITIHQHHHHHHYPQGEGFIDDLKNAFDPKKNGVAKAFEPGGSAEKFGREVGHYGIPALTGAVGGLAGSALGGLASAGLGSFAGGVAGSALGSKAGQEINKMAGLGFKKGSQEAKDHMAKIRAMRRK
jgi:hypothetical protein